VVNDAPGFFGKVQTQGDFVSRRLPAEFLGPWDACLQRGMLHARAVFGAQWLPVYLTAPVWCFSLGPQVCGASAWAGVVLPGVDRVGRHFPFTIAAAVDDIGSWLRGAPEWYDRVEEIALSTLAEDFQLDRFDERLAELPMKFEPVAWRFDVAGDANTRLDFADWISSAAVPGSSVWWSEGSAQVPASVFSCSGLIDAQRFARLFDVSADSSHVHMQLIVRSSG
jgi:type VI secretion system protein ImpM